MNNEPAVVSLRLRFGYDLSDNKSGTIIQKNYEWGTREL